MNICYQNINGVEFGKLPGRSVRVNGKVKKEGVVYLGKVIDKANYVFWTRADGLYVFDPETGDKKPCPETYVSEVKQDRRKRIKTSVDYGDAFFISSLIEKMGYEQVLDSISYKNRDSLHAMILYYILQKSANQYAGTWLEGSFARVLYPNADLTSQRVSDLLKTLGSDHNRHSYFDAHIKWVKEHICDDPAALLDSTGLPSSIALSLTAINNHNGKISKEIRLSVPVQRDSGFPLLFHVSQGNIVDVTTLARDISELDQHGMTVDMALFDAGYDSNFNFDELFRAQIDFISRLDAKFGVYKQIVRDNAGTLKRDENIVEYNGRCLYIKQVTCLIGKNKNKAYAYIGCDMNRYNDELHQMLTKIKKQKATTDGFGEMLAGAGIFVLVSSLPYKANEILPAYYARQFVEQFFDVGKGSARLTPLRVHSESSLYGHILLSMIASTIFMYIQRHKNRIYDSSDELFMGLRNHKCDIWHTKIVVDSPSNLANDLYRSFSISVPVVYDTQIPPL